MAGRPTILTDKIQDKIARNVGAGAFLEDSARLAGVNPSSVYAWIAKGSDEARRLESVWAQLGIDQLDTDEQVEQLLEEYPEAKPAPYKVKYLRFAEAIAHARARANDDDMRTLQWHSKFDARWALERLKLRNPDLVRRTEPTPVIEGRLSLEISTATETINDEVLEAAENVIDALERAEEDTRPQLEPGGAGEHNTDGAGQDREQTVD